MFEMKKNTHLLFVYIVHFLFTEIKVYKPPFFLNSSFNFVNEDATNLLKIYDCLMICEYIF